MSLFVKTVFAKTLSVKPVMGTSDGTLDKTFAKAPVWLKSAMAAALIAIAAPGLALAQNNEARAAAPTCPNTVQANVAAIDQPFMVNRLGAALPQGMIFALTRDVAPLDSNGNPQKTNCEATPCEAGKVMLRPSKRPRPITLRVNQGDCLLINFTNLVSPATTNDNQTSTRQAGVHVQGLDLVSVNGQPAINSDASFVGANPSSLAVPGRSLQYKYFASDEGTFLLFSTADDFTNTAGQLGLGLFGAVNVEVANAEWYRSQVTNDDLRLATYNGNPPQKLPANSTLVCPGGSGEQTCKLIYNGPYPSEVTVIKTAGDPNWADGTLLTPGRQPLVNYTAIYPPGAQWPDGTPIPANTPVLGMLDSRGNIVHSDLTAVITGPNQGEFTGSAPQQAPNPAYPNRRQPFREFTIMYHEMPGTVQAFNIYSNSTIKKTINAGADQFAINYGAAGIGSEIIANRLGVGPMGNCTECKFEEFFLSSWAVGDPAMAVDVPANAPAAQPPSNPPYPPCPPTGAAADAPNCSQLGSNSYNSAPASTQISLSLTGNGVLSSTNGGGASIVTGPTGQVVPYVVQPVVKATEAFFPDDPSNVYHSYMDDHTKFRLLHAGQALPHVHHLHAHQWLETPNSDQSTYLDSQLINPGATYTLEIAYDGGGNLNKTVGDSIFHCHFYPHFAAGMWALWRVHDVFEAGSILKNGAIDPSANGGWNRVLPDGEITAGTPIPAIVPLPTIPMATMPARVKDCPVFATANNSSSTYTTNWNSSSFVGLACPGRPAGATLAGYAALVNQDDLSKGMNPGFPFFVPGITGHRPTHPPLDFADAPDGTELNGGLPRHEVLGGRLNNERHNQWDFSKDTDRLVAIQIPETGNPAERVAMATHSARNHPSYTPLGQFGYFVLNGLPSEHGAPFANPAREEDGQPAKNKRVYKAADIQMDVVFNKKGWHYPQERLITLWEDVQPTLQGEKPPEPFFFRANTGDVIEYWHTNLVPDYYDLDDFQVRTPTDILGQHIHLVKFDVLASDGAANGFNYEDGTLSPEDVQSRIAAINLAGGLYSPDGSTRNRLTPKRPYYFCDPKFAGEPWYQHYCQAEPGHLGEWVGAQTTIQRWFADPLLDNNGHDRTLRTVFTHDHFGPSTHQQAGLYAGLVIEPENSSWSIPAYYDEDGKLQTGVPMPSQDRMDGGPTSWNADIKLNSDVANSYREFVLEFQDLSLAYLRGSTESEKLYPGPGSGLAYPQINSTTGLINNLSSASPWGWADATQAVNPFQASLGYTAPQIISANLSVGTMGLNYRSEPPPLRVTDPANPTVPLAGIQGDLSYAFSSMLRKDIDLNCQPFGQITGQGCLATVKPPRCANAQNPVNPNGFNFPKPFPGAQCYDPFTPLMRAYENDKVQVRVLVGAHVLPHFFTMHGNKWFFEPGTPTDPKAKFNSGYRATQGMGISEHFEMLFTAPTAGTTTYGDGSPTQFADYVYAPGADQTSTQQGVWGLFRAFNGKTSVQPDLPKLPNNPAGTAPARMTGCPPNSLGTLTYDVTAISAAQALPPPPGSKPGTPGVLTYNSRGAGTTGKDPIYDPDAIIYVFTKDLNIVRDNYGKVTSATLKPGVPVEPIVLRAAAGVCVKATLRNGLNPGQLDINGKNIFTDDSMSSDGVTLVPEDSGTPVSTFTSTTVGLRPQLLSLDITKDNGANAGFDPIQTVAVTDAPCETAMPDGSASPYPCRQYQWYAGNIQYNANGTTSGIPVEFGAGTLLPSDPLMQDPRGLVGALGIEPAGSSWCPDVNSNASASVYFAALDCGDRGARAGAPGFREFFTVMENDIAHETQANGLASTGAVNYRSEPLSYRFNNSDLSGDVSNAFSNTLVNAPPQTPVFAAAAGSQVRFRMLHPGGVQPGQTMIIHGHSWQQEPYLENSQVIVPNPRYPESNPVSQQLGSTNHGPDVHTDIVIEQAGGVEDAPGDYLYRTFLADQIQEGIWGLFAVTHSDRVYIDTYGPCKDAANKGKACVSGTNTVDPKTGEFASSVRVFSGPVAEGIQIGKATVDGNGNWEVAIEGQPQTISAKSDAGGIQQASFAAPPPTPAHKLLRAHPAQPQAHKEDPLERFRIPTFKQAEELAHEREHALEVDKAREKAAEKSPKGKKAKKEKNKN